MQLIFDPSDTKHSIVRFQAMEYPASLTGNCFVIDEKKSKSQFALTLTFAVIQYCCQIESVDALGQLSNGKGEGNYVYITNTMNECLFQNNK